MNRVKLKTHFLFMFFFLFFFFYYYYYYLLYHLSRLWNKNKKLICKLFQSLFARHTHKRLR